MTAPIIESFAEQGMLAFSRKEGACQGHTEDGCRTECVCRELVRDIISAVYPMIVEKVALYCEANNMGMSIRRDGPFNGWHANPADATAYAFHGGRLARLATLEAIPGIEDVIAGKAVVVPKEPADEMVRVACSFSLDIGLPVCECTEPCDIERKALAAALASSPYSKGE